MWNWIKSLFSSPERARNESGKFVADNPATPKNEAWVGGKAPAKKRGPKKGTKRVTTKKNK